MTKQECIPVGCVPSTAVAVYWGGGCLRGGGVCLGGCLPAGVSACGPGRGVSARCLWTEFLTHACENITFVADGNQTFLRLRNNSPIEINLVNYAVTHKQWLCLLYIFEGEGKLTFSTALHKGK